ncbi:hypothetical protein N7495_002249 [Penicillium taxi]|uniref:uncharacterized protein n=1 Tax=Penicillium taxi TaxID=168475 RepID=UPI0025457BCA|nr:uncharacterized protein N7495_002249 [Penicillium taxi]KAJ5901721.1 hypothetical protein N7495_002249 [Penicillium taxi]
MRLAIMFASTLALASATKINMHCEFAQDKTGMVQSPYCCRDLKSARNNPKVNEANDCDLLTQPQLCEDQSRPACCYSIEKKKICTSHVIFMDAADV